MMFLQFFIWGAWYTTIGNYMSAHGMSSQAYLPYTVNPIAAIVAPFFLGLIADRYFATQRVLGVLHLLGGVLMLLVPGATGSPGLFVFLILLYNLCYMPTLGLANSLAFHNISDQENEESRGASGSRDQEHQHPTQQVQDAQHSLRREIAIRDQAKEERRYNRGDGVHRVWQIRVGRHAVSRHVVPDRRVPRPPDEELEEHHR